MLGEFGVASGVDFGRGSAARMSIVRVLN